MKIRLCVVSSNGIEYNLGKVLLSVGDGWQKYLFIKGGLILEDIDFGPIANKRLNNSPVQKIWILKLYTTKGQLNS